MIKRSTSGKRSGAVVVESAIVLPVALMVVLAIVSGALAVFTYQQVASLAREGARSASVHGTEYAESQGTTAWTKDDVYTNAIVPYLVNIDTTKLTYDVTWSPDKKPGSYVTVTLTYQMDVPIYGTMTFQSTASQVMTW